ncbi:MAG: hypothetical protein QOJ88_177 [Pyrinomonadaceae bacterium]|nr:hypothetical protein [Pyrinomonadaceae bacterium]
MLNPFLCETSAFFAVDASERKNFNAEGTKVSQSTQRLI